MSAALYSHASSRLTFTLFCRVVDNFGDIGVCWRLAQQLAGELGQRVHLWVDDLHSFAALCDAINPALTQQSCRDITIWHWQQASEQAFEATDVVIEAFACDLPPTVIDRLLAANSLWLNLEYLTAEDWADSCHLSPSPVRGGRKYFFFPGFSAATGGLLYDDALIAKAAQSPHSLRAQLLAHAGVSAENLKPESRWISLFGYASAPYRDWAEALAISAAEHGEHWVIWVCGRYSQASLQALCPHPLVAGQVWQQGWLTWIMTPQLNQNHHDTLLAACEINLVRGEESFVRTQMLARPFIWHIYPQNDAAHLDKLSAFLNRYTQNATPELAEALRHWHSLWNGDALAPNALLTAWQSLLTQWPAWQAHAHHWQTERLQYPGLAHQLWQFCADQLQPQRGNP